MRALVVYSSQFGSTREIAERIAIRLGEQDVDVTLRAASDEHAALDLDQFDGFVIGSAIHAHHWLRPAVDFVKTNSSILSRRPAWLFSSGPIGEDAVQAEQPEPKEIEGFRDLVDVHDHVVFAGAFDPAHADWSDTSWLERNIARRFIPVGDFRDWDKIDAWALGIARYLSRTLAAAAAR